MDTVQTVVCVLIFVAGFGMAGTLCMNAFNKSLDQRMELITSGKQFRHEYSTYKCQMTNKLEFEK
jgi:hypothetical protein